MGLDDLSVALDSDFFDLGGHSLLAVQLTSAIAKSFQKDVSVREVYEHGTVEGLVRSMERQELDDSVLSEDLLETLQGDAKLSPALKPASTAKASSWEDAQRIFLTGATGFLGAFLLEELLRKTAAEVHCLVRAPSAVEGKARLMRTLEDYGLAGQFDPKRIVAVVGDLGKPLLGLGETEFGKLATHTDFIFHCAAFVNYVYPYAKLKPATVNGTQEVIRLACEETRTPVVYISTNGIAPEGAGVRVPETQAIDGFLKDLEVGYSQAKWVAEKLAWEASARGLPVCIVRPGNIGHHSQSGAHNPNDLQYHFLKACLTLGCVPDQKEWSLELTPVDHFVKSLLALARRQEGFGKVFQSVSDTPVPWADLREVFGDAVSVVSLNDWKEAVLKKALSSGDSSFGILSQTFDDLNRTLRPVNLHETSSLRAVQKQAGLEAPELSDQYFRKFLESAKKRAQIGLSG